MTEGALEPAPLRLRLELVAAGACLAESGLIVPGEGNLSVRVDRHRFLITPTGADKGRLAPENLVLVDVEEERAPREASREARLHADVYRRCPTVMAVVHAHPRSVLDLPAEDLPPSLDVPDDVTAVRTPVTRVEWLEPGSPRLATAVARACLVAPVVVLERHGAVTIGGSLAEAVDRMLWLDRLAARGTGSPA
jgi:L-fuculose-phosphate aldolase